MKIAITGKITAGKSTAVKLARELLPGYFFVSADEVAKTIREHPKYQEMLMVEHGTRVPSELRPFIASSKTIRDITKQTILYMASLIEEHENVIAEVPTLLSSNNLSIIFDTVLFISVPIEVQRERMSDRGYSEVAMNAFLLQQQFDESDPRITHVIQNIGSLDNLKNELEIVFLSLTAKS